MAIKDTIHLQVYSDTEMNDFAITNVTQKNESGGTVSTMSLTKQQNADVGLIWTITASKNNELSNHTLKFRATAKFSGETITTPYLTIAQDKHPNKYSEGVVKMATSDGSFSGDTINFSERGGRFTIKVKAIQDETGDVLSNISYFRFTSLSNPEFIKEITVFEANGYAQAQYKVSPNKSLKKRKSQIVIIFNDKNGSSWHKVVNVEQDEHVKVISDVVFNYRPLNIGHTGGNILINCSYKEDGEVMELSGVSVVSGSTFNPNDYYLPDSGATRTMTINENTDETPNGAPTKLMRLQAIHPVTNNNIVGDLIQQESRKSSSYIFTFSDGTTNKITEDTISSMGDYFSCSVISKKDGTDIPFEPSSNVGWIAVEAPRNGSFMIEVDENTDENARFGIITVKQSEDQMPNLTYQISQKGKNKFQIPNFDYMIIKVGSDMFSGESLNLFLYAPDMPEEYQQFKLAGYNASNILRENLLPDKLYDFTDEGDEENNVLRWSGDNRNVGGESYVVSPKKFLTSDFINAEIEKGNTTFDIHLYGYFNSFRSNLATIAMEAYKSDGTSASSPQLLNKKGNLFFYPGQNATQISRIWKNAYLNGDVKEPEEWLRNYTKIATFRYTYRTGVWEFIQNDSVVAHPTEEEKEGVIESMTSATTVFENTLIEVGNQDLINDYLFGYVRDNKTTEPVQFFALGKNKVARFKFNDTLEHEIVSAYLHYDQTKYNITKVALGGYKSSISTIEWSQNWDYLQDDPWIVNGKPEEDDKLYLYFEAIDKNESDDYGEAEKDTYHFANFGSTSEAIPEDELRGEFTDAERGIIVPFTIESASASGGAYRKIRWKRHVPETTACTFKMTKLVYDKSSFVLAGINTYASTPIRLPGPEMSELVYQPNSQNCNLAFAWQNHNSYRITLKVKAWGNDDTQTKVEYAQSNTSSRPNTYVKYNTFDGPNGFMSVSTYIISLDLPITEGEYLHLKVTCSDSMNNKSLFKYTKNTVDTFELDFAIFINT